MLSSIGIYTRNDPQALFRYLSKLQTNTDTTQLEILLWVDNDDHKVSSEFYTLRKYIRKGLNIKVFINPPLASVEEVSDWLKTQAAYSYGFRDNTK
jgi:hypothetical protein